MTIFQARLKLRWPLARSRPSVGYWNTYSTVFFFFFGIDGYIETLRRALGVAARKFQNEIGTMIADHILEEPVTIISLPKPWADIGIMEPIQYGNGALLVDLLWKRRRIESSWRDHEQDNGLAIDDKELCSLLRRGSCSTIEYRLKCGLIHPDKTSIHLPMDLVLDCNRYDIARLLLNHSVDLEARSAAGTTALKLTVLGLYTVHKAMFLIKNGADPTSVRRGHPTLYLLHRHVCAYF